jgi:hypothetical protein
MCVLIINSYVIIFLIELVVYVNTKYLNFLKKKTNSNVEYDLLFVYV